MSNFELDEAAVARTEEMLRETGEAVNTEARRASDLITSLNGSGWQGAANTVASNKQTGDFATAVSKLHAEINHISEALGLGRQSTMTEDQSSEQAFQAVTPDVGNFTRL